LIHNAPTSEPVSTISIAEYDDVNNSAYRNVVSFVNCSTDTLSITVRRVSRKRLSRESMTVRRKGPVEGLELLARKKSQREVFHGKIGGMHGATVRPQRAP
jgi:hypothetical protein